MGEAAAVVELPAVEPPRTSRAIAIVDFVVRLAYFAFVPIVLYFISLVFPITGALINLALVLVFFMLGPILRPHIEKRRLAAKLLKKFLVFEAYYREHPPRPFVYYLFYPLLFPYWLFNKRARREFLLYRGLSVVALVIMIGLALLQYFTKWRPEIDFVIFAEVFAIVFLIQGLIVIAMMLPLATTVITYSRTGKKKRLVLLLVAALLSTGAAIASRWNKRHELMPAMTNARLNARTAAAPMEAGKVLREAMVAAWKTKDFDRDRDFKKDVVGGVEIVGPPLDNAREKLESFYKADEAEGFSIVMVPSQKYGALMVLYVAYGKKLQLWLAMDGKFTFSNDATKLPPGTFEVLKGFAGR